MAQYLAELRKLTEHCDFCNNLDETLRDRLVCGILSVPIQKRLLAEKDLDLKKAMELAKAWRQPQSSPVNCAQPVDLCL